VTPTEAKELLIGGMNYAAYREEGYSLWPSDMNRLFGEQHYPEDCPNYSASVWGEGDEFEGKAAQLLKWAIRLGTSLGSYPDALALLRNDDGCLGRVIRKASL